MKALSDCQLYGIVDLGYVRALEAVAMCERMIDGGVDIIQLRAKGASEEEIESLGSQLLAVTEPAGVPFLLNDHPQLVPSIGAQGAHVGQEDFAVDEARWRAGRALGNEVALPIIGKSTHGYQQALAAEAAGADYIGFGPLYATATKPGREAIGLEEIRRVTQGVAIPVFCIGGIKLETLAAVLEAGAQRVVIVSELLQARDIVGYCRQVRSLLPRLG